MKSESEAKKKIYPSYTMWFPVRYVNLNLETYQRCYVCGFPAELDYFYTVVAGCFIYIFSPEKHDFYHGESPERRFWI